MERQDDGGLREASKSKASQKGYGSEDDALKLIELVSINVPKQH